MLNGVGNILRNNIFKVTEISARVKKTFFKHTEGIVLLVQQYDICADDGILECCPVAGGGR